MSSYPPLDQLKALKRKVFARYCDKRWFGGCQINTDEPVACLELLTVPDRPEKSFEEDGILVRAVDIDWADARRHQEEWKQDAFDNWCTQMKELYL